MLERGSVSPGVLPIQTPPSQTPPSPQLCKNTSCTPAGAPEPPPPPPPLKPRGDFHKRPRARKELPSQTAGQRSELSQRKKQAQSLRDSQQSVLCVTVSQEFSKPRAQRSCLGSAPKSRWCFHPQACLEPLNQVLTWR